MDASRTHHTHLARAARQTGATGAEPAAQRGDASAVKERRRLLCRRCLSPITSERQRIAIGGQHSHRRTNPFGISFLFGCFRAASGARSEGQPTSDHSWFRGYAWSYALCGHCGRHLGWYFEGTKPAFFGLIRDRLLEEDLEGAPTA